MWIEQILCEMHVRENENVFAKHLDFCINNDHIKIFQNLFGLYLIGIIQIINLN